MEDVEEGLEGPDGSEGDRETKTRRVRRTLTRVLSEDNPAQFQAVVRARRGNRRLWLWGLLQ